MTDKWEPELLEACKMADAILSNAFSSSVPDIVAEEHPAVAAVMRLLRAAIARAERA